MGTKEQIQNTKLTIIENQRHAELIDMQDLNQLLNEIGLKIDLKADCMMLYYNTANKNKWLEINGVVVDKEGLQPFNINSKWYQKNVPNQTQDYKRFKEIRNDYFCIINGYIHSI